MPLCPVIYLQDEIEITRVRPPVVCKGDIDTHNLPSLRILGIDVKAFDQEIWCHHIDRLCVSVVHIINLIYPVLRIHNHCYVVVACDIHTIEILHYPFNLCISGSIARGKRYTCVSYLMLFSLIDDIEAHINDAATV